MEEPRVLQAEILRRFGAGALLDAVAYVAGRVHPKKMGRDRGGGGSCTAAGAERPRPRRRLNPNPNPNPKTL